MMKNGRINKKQFDSLKLSKMFGNGPDKIERG